MAAIDVFQAEIAGLSGLTSLYRVRQEFGFIWIANAEAGDRVAQAFLLGMHVFLGNCDEGVVHECAYCGAVRFGKNRPPSDFVLIIPDTRDFKSAMIAAFCRSCSDKSNESLYQSVCNSLGQVWEKTALIPDTPVGSA